MPPIRILEEKDIVVLLRAEVQKAETGGHELQAHRRRSYGAQRDAGERKVMTETGARYAIVVDGTVRTHRDRREAAYEAANVLKALSPYAKIVIRDLQTGQEIDPQKSDGQLWPREDAEVRSWVEKLAA
jgi:hypothetical protein